MNSLLLTAELDTAACLADVAAWRERLRTCFYTPEVAAKLLEKTGFDALARSHGAPVPVTEVITPGDADSAARANRLRFPVVVKPVSRDPRYDARFRKAYRIADAPEHHHELTEITVGFLRQVGFRGLLGMEYKRDPRDGRFYMIEPTVYRTDYQHEIATLSGVPFLAAVVARLRGLAAGPEGSYSNRCYWVDNPAARHSAKAGRGGSGGTVEPVALAARRVDAWFRISDPLPGAMHYSRLLAAKLRKMLRRRRGAPDMNKKSVRNA